jgi:hypothetical protein
VTDTSGKASSVDLDGFDLGVHYGHVRKRLSDLVGEIDDPARVAVPACPKWSVHDVLAHLVAVVEDVLAGRLTGPPSDEDTAAQVARRQDIATAEVLAQWAEMAPTFEGLLSEARVWPGFLDVLAHEHDVRGAVSAPAGRDSLEMQAASEWLMTAWAPDVPLRVKVGEREHNLGPGTDPDLTLTTTPFESFRFRLGRRSPAQLRAMDWTGDPTPILAELTIFGPEPYDVIE